MQWVGTYICTADACLTSAPHHSGLSFTSKVCDPLIHPFSASGQGNHYITVNVPLPARTSTALLRARVLLFPEQSSSAFAALL